MWLPGRTPKVQNGFDAIGSICLETPMVRMIGAIDPGGDLREVMPVLAQNAMIKPVEM